MHQDLLHASSSTYHRHVLLRLDAQEERVVVTPLVSVFVIIVHLTVVVCTPSHSRRQLLSSFVLADAVLLNASPHSLRSA